MEILYNKKTKELIIEYNQFDIRKYKNIPEKLYNNLLNSNNINKFILDNIEGKFELEKNEEIKIVYG